MTSPINLRCGDIFSAKTQTVKVQSFSHMIKEHKWVSVEGVTIRFGEKWYFDRLKCFKRLGEPNLITDIYLIYDEVDPDSGVGFVNLYKDVAITGHSDADKVPLGLGVTNEETGKVW